MHKGERPIGVTQKGKSIPKKKLSLATRVANNSQKKIDTLNRIDDVTLKSVNRFYDLEMIIYEAGHKKNSYLLKKQISAYQKSLNESRTQRQKTARRTFMTQPSPSPDKLEPTLPESPFPTLPNMPPRPKYGAFINCDPEAIGSVRRKTKTLLTSSLSKSMTDLQKLRAKHIAEYRQAMMELDKLKSRFEVPFTVNVSCRSYTPLTAVTPYSPIIASLRNKIQYSENELAKLQKKLQMLSTRYERPKTTAFAEQEEKEEEEEEEEVPDKNPDTFHIFCQKDGNQAPGELSRRRSSLLSRPITTNPPPRKRKNSRAVKFDLDKMKMEGSISLPMLNLLVNNSRNAHIEIIDNPFDTGELPATTRSRLLIESKKDDTMYQWLGFKTQAQLNAALKEDPKRIKQIPAALLNLIEDEEDANLDEEQFSDTDSEKEEDEDDLRFKVFDRRKFKERRTSTIVNPNRLRKDK